jgi:hypothetical protein
MTTVPLDGMRIFKYRTGDEIPAGSIYLMSIRNEKLPDHEDDKRKVWHYFLVKE